ncbi:MAG: DUF2341 domain-containing protein [Candidatus Nitrosoabyssus spongiisocia]|nr:MAG: DUF2341 domain-containing protein [Nitrosopumilaceae archaeon AB1(1)]
MNGNNVVYVKLGSSYSEQNATTDDDSPIVIGGDTVDTNTAANYTITYNSADSSGNDAIQVNRTVVVQQILGASWDTRLQITINSSQVIGNHENFTVLISINDINLNSTTVQSAGQDIRFTTTDGNTLLEHEIESFTNDATTGTLVAWVRLPTLSNTSDTILYMYYNVSTASSIPYPNVWDSDYEIIYHMDQSTFTANSTLDSSGNDCHATPLSTGSTDFNSNDLVSAQIGNGLNFDGVDNNTGDYLDLPDLEGSLFNNTDFTISAWANIDVLKNWARIVDFGNGQDDNNILIAAHRTNPHLRYDMRQGTSSDGVTASDILQTGQWAYFTVVHESSGTATIYKNGTSITSGSVHTSLNESRASNYIGRSNWANDYYFDGKFDEFRLSSTARSADWIATEYANQNSPSTFFTISAPEDRSVAISFAITNTQGDNIIITFNKNIIYSVIPTTDFTLTGTSATIDSITSNSSSITLNLSGNLLSNEIITISYTKTSGGINSTQSTDITLENFVNQPITNNILPPPIFVNAYTNQQGDIITVNFDKVVTLTNTTSPTDFAVNISGITTTSITRHNDTAINLTLDSNILPALPLTLSYNQTTSSITNVNDLSLANFTNQPITNNAQIIDLHSLWDTRQKITINSNQIVTTLQNFTLLVSISDSTLNNSVCSI